MAAGGLSQWPGSSGCPALGGGLACTPRDGPLAPPQRPLAVTHELSLPPLKAGAVGFGSRPQQPQPDRIQALGPV